MILSGFTDEAGADLDTQIKVTQEIGWKHISARMIGGSNIHDLPENKFEEVVEQLTDANISVLEFGSLIGNWAKPIESDFATTISEIDRAIPRMQRLNTKLVRIMSYAQKPWGEDQKETIRFERLREIVKRFADAGIQALHENCMNWGGFSSSHTLRLIEEVPGLKLIFDTGNPVFQRDRSLQPNFPWQNPINFLNTVIDHVEHIHIKDCLNPRPGDQEPEEYSYPGEGQAKVPEILQILKNKKYQGAYAIEPHIATVFHAQDNSKNPEESYSSYVKYAKQFEHLIKS